MNPTEPTAPTNAMPAAQPDQPTVTQPLSHQNAGTAVEQSLSQLGLVVSGHEKVADKTKDAVAKFVKNATDDLHNLLEKVEAEITGNVTSNNPQQ